MSSTNFGPSAVEPAKDSTEKPWIERRRTYTAHALIAFNVYGIPLSAGPYLEYFYNTMFPSTSLASLSPIIALQLTFIFAMGFPAKHLYQRNHWRRYLYLTIILAGISHLGLAFVGQWWLIIILRGIVMGTSLGFLRSTSLLFLASHYKNNTSLVSMQSGAAAMTGAAFYTVLAWIFLRTSRYKTLSMVNCGVCSVTLVLATMLLSKSKQYNLEATSPEHSHSPFRDRGKWWFLSGYLLVFLGLFIWPTFVPLLICGLSLNQFPDVAAPILFTLFGVGALSSAYFANSYSRTSLGHINIYIPSVILTGLCYIIVAFMPFRSVIWICSAFYGFGLGPILAMHTKVISIVPWSNESYREDLQCGLTLVSFVAGCAIFGGIMMTAGIVQTTGSFKVPFLLLGGAVNFGGLLMAIGRWKRYEKFKAVI